MASLSKRNSCLSVSISDLINFRRNHEDPIFHCGKYSEMEELIRTKIKKASREEKKEAAHSFLLSENYEGLRVMLDNGVNMPPLFKGLDPESDVYYNIYIRHPGRHELMNLVYLFPEGNSKSKKGVDWDQYQLRNNPNYVVLPHSGIPPSFPSDNSRASRKPDTIGSSYRPLWYIEQHPEIKWLWQPYPARMKKNSDGWTLREQILIKSFSYWGNVSENPNMTVGFVLANLNRIYFGRYGLSGNLFGKDPAIAAKIKQEKIVVGGRFKQEEYLGPTMKATRGVADIVMEYY